MRGYLTISKDQARVMTRVKALYRSWAIPCTGKQVYAPRYRAEWLTKVTLMTLTACFVFWSASSFVAYLAVSSYRRRRWGGCGALAWRSLTSPAGLDDLFVCLSVKVLCGLPSRLRCLKPRWNRVIHGTAGDRRAGIALVAVLILKECEEGA